MIQTIDPGIEQLTEELANGKEALSAFKGLSIDDALSKLANSLVDFGFKLCIAILVFYLGQFIIRKIYKATLHVMTRRKVDPSLTTFVLSLVKMVLYFILIITVIGILGIETSSFLALFASAGVAIGMALSGTLQNFAGGVLILLLKPYKVGDYIEVQGYSGTVKSIQLFSTVINTVDNKSIIIPNGGLSTGSINNFSTERYRRVDWTIGLSYGTDYAAAKEKIIEMLKSDVRVVTDKISDHDEAREKRLAEEATQKAIEIQQKREEICEEHPELCEEEPEKLSWWRRLISHTSRKRESIKSTLADDSLVMNAKLPEDNVSRPPFVGLSELADSSINLTVRAWAHSDDYWPLFFEMNERFYRELPEAGFTFPFPQLDVHFDEQKK